MGSLASSHKIQGMSSLDGPQEPVKKAAGMEYDLRRPTIGRVKHRWWNN